MAETRQLVKQNPTTIARCYRLPNAVGVFVSVLECFYFKKVLKLFLSDEVIILF
jgi:hypothetical protein